MSKTIRRDEWMEYIDVPVRTPHLIRHGKPAKLRNWFAARRQSTKRSRRHKQVNFG